MSTFEEDLPEMIKETTGLVLLHLNGDHKLHDDFMIVLKQGRTKKHKSRLLKFWATRVAKQNNDEFGPLFIQELDLVDWKKVRRELQREV